MPVDYGSSDSLDDYVSELGYLEGLLDNEKYDCAILLGDFNADLRRQDGRFSGRLRSLLNEYHLVTIGLEDADMTNRNTWHSHDFVLESWIDYVCVSTSLNDRVEEFCIREGMCVTSDHWAISVSLRCGIDTNVSTEGNSPCQRRLLWKEASIADLDEYTGRVEMELETIYVPAA